MKLIFLVSQPRSGSTMMQAVLSNHPAITTKSEPWVQLLQAPIVNPSLIKASFDWRLTMDAVKSLELGDDCLSQVSKRIKEVVDGYYKNELDQAGAEFFLDKTPRYYNMLDYLYESYPDAHFVVLRRHPASVLASIHKTWHNGKGVESLYYYSEDLIEAPRLMDKFTNKYGHSNRVKEIDYESLISSPNETFSSVFEWLGLDYRDELLSYEQNASYHGKYGDPTGVQQGAVVAREPVYDKKYREQIPSKRVAKLAAGLTHYWKTNNYIICGNDHWEKPYRTKEFNRYLKVHKLKSRNGISSKEHLHILACRLLDRLGV